MKIPPNMTAAEVNDCIERNANRLARKHSFACFTPDDIRQECRLEAVKLLDSGVYDGIRELDPLMWGHFNKRLLNLRRKHLRRSDSPCKKCQSGAHCTTTDKPCRKYAEWLHRNQTKANLLQPLELEPSAEHKSLESRQCKYEPCEVAANREVFDIIDRELPAQLRESYLRMRDGVSVPAERVAEVSLAVIEILAGHGLGAEDF